MRTRHTDSHRRPPLTEQLLREAARRGEEIGTPEAFEGLCERLRAEGALEGTPSWYIGDALSEADLDALWAVLAGEEPDPDSTLPGWWEDKPHQLAYRLILRLTRAEQRLADISSIPIDRTDP